MKIDKATERKAIRAYVNRKKRKKIAKINRLLSIFAFMLLLGFVFILGGLWLWRPCF